MQPLDRLATFAQDITKFKKWYADKKKIIDSLPGKTSVDQASQSLGERLPGKGQINVKSAWEKVAAVKTKQMIDKAASDLAQYSNVVLSKSAIFQATKIDKVKEVIETEEIELSYLLQLLKLFL